MGGPRTTGDGAGDGAAMAIGKAGEARRSFKEGQD
jgi:hypothetical protein